MISSSATFIATLKDPHKNLGTDLIQANLSAKKSHPNPNGQEERILPSEEAADGQTRHLRVSGHGSSMNRIFIVEECAEDEFGRP